MCQSPCLQQEVNRSHFTLSQKLVHLLMEAALSEGLLRIKGAID